MMNLVAKPICSLYTLFSATLFFFSDSAISAQTLKCATTHYPPFTIFDSKSGKFTGDDMEIINPVFKNSQLNFAVENLPWARLKEEIKHDNYDCYFSLAKLPDREIHLEYTVAPVHVTKMAVFYTKPPTNNTMNFSDQIIGIHRGINIHNYIPEKYGIHSAKLHKANSNKTLFKMLQRGRVDAVVTNKDVGNYILENDYKDLTAQSLDIEGYQLPVYLAFRKGVIDISTINKELIKLTP